ncbi:MAG: hypothetical protein JW946_05070, partial [Candidatus Omnitrophica bacterium]|nr:hypothetical protein [Candidatus Omnitrophota bacterium]
VFTNKNQGAIAARGVSDEKDAVSKAMEFEKKSVVFYEGMKKIVPEYDHRLIDALINQEKSHIKKLYDLSALMGITDSIMKEVFLWTKK